MLKITFDPMDGEVVPEGRVTAYVGRVLGAYRMGKLSHAIVGSSLLINEFRLALKERRLKPEEISFLFEDQTLTHTADGRFTDWPRGFCDVMDDQLRRLLRPC